MSYGEVLQSGSKERHLNPLANEENSQLSQKPELFAGANFCVINIQSLVAPCLRKSKRSTNSLKRHRHFQSSDEEDLYTISVKREATFFFSNATLFTIPTLTLYLHFYYTNFYPYNILGDFTTHTYTPYTCTTIQYDAKRQGMEELPNYLQYDTNATKNDTNTAIRLLNN